MFAQKFVNSWKKPFGFTQSKAKRSNRRVDLVAEQVKKVLQTSDQKLILMVRS